MNSLIGILNDDGLEAYGRTTTDTSSRPEDEYTEIGIMYSHSI